MDEREVFFTTFPLFSPKIAPKSAQIAKKNAQKYQFSGRDSYFWVVILIFWDMESYFLDNG